MELTYWDRTKPVLPLARYDLVVFPAQNMMPVLANGSTIGKMVAGLPGDTVRVQHGDVYINGVFIGDVRYGARRLKKPPGYWDKTYTLGKDEIFVYGSEENSWDSRYWGPYPLHRVAGRLAAVF